jgi:hypothetical protein
MVSPQTAQCLQMLATLRQEQTGLHDMAVAVLALKRDILQQVPLFEYILRKWIEIPLFNLPRWPL